MVSHHLLHLGFEHFKLGVETRSDAARVDALLKEAILYHNSGVAQVAVELFNQLNNQAGIASIVEYKKKHQGPGGFGSEIAEIGNPIIVSGLENLQDVIEQALSRPRPNPNLVDITPSLTTDTEITLTAAIVVDNTMLGIGPTDDQLEVISQQSNNPNVIYAKAVVYSGLGMTEQAIKMLSDLDTLSILNRGLPGPLAGMMTMPSIESFIFGKGAASGSYPTHSFFTDVKDSPEYLRLVASHVIIDYLEGDLPIGELEEPQIKKLSARANQVAEGGYKREKSNSLSRYSLHQVELANLDPSDEKYNPDGYNNALQASLELSHILGESDPKTAGLIAIAYNGTGQPDEAISALRKVGSGLLPLGNLEMALSHTLLEDYPSALAELTIALEAQPIIAATLGKPPYSVLADKLSSLSGYSELISNANMMINPNP